MTRDLAWAALRAVSYVQLPKNRANAKIGSVLLQCLFFVWTSASPRACFCIPEADPCCLLVSFPSLADLALQWQLLLFFLQQDRRACAAQRSLHQHLCTPQLESSWFSCPALLITFSTVWEPLLLCFWNCLWHAWRNMDRLWHSAQPPTVFELVCNEFKCCSTINIFCLATPASPVSSLIFWDTWAAWDLGQYGGGL